MLCGKQHNEIEVPRPRTGRALAEGAEDQKHVQQPATEPYQRVKVRKAIQGTLSHHSIGYVGSLSVPGVIILQKPRKTNLKLSNRPENIG